MLTRAGNLQLQALDLVGYGSWFFNDWLIWRVGFLPQPKVMPPGGFSKRTFRFHESCSRPIPP